MFNISSEVSIRVKILRVVLAYSFLIMLLLPLIQSYKSISETKDDLNNLNNQISIMSIENLSNSIWGFDNISYMKIIEGILKLDPVGAVLLKDPFGNKMANLSKKDFLDYNSSIKDDKSFIKEYFFGDIFTLDYNIFYKKESIANLKVYINSDKVISDFLNTILYSTINLFLLIIITLFIIEKTFYKLVTGPLERISLYISNIDTHSNKQYEIPLEEANKHNEIGLLTKRFNKSFNSLFHMKNDLIKIATTDTLTKLQNRNSLNHKFEEIINTKEEYTILLMDIDDFKDVNDLLGHDVGDFVLITMAERINKILEDNSWLYRLGGDEFVIIFKDIITKEKIFEKIRKIINITSETIPYKNDGIKLSMSIGISLYPSLAKSRTSILKQCDIAMYEVKKQGGNNFLIYNEKMNSAIILANQVSSLITWALENNKFLAYYQAKVSTKTKEVVGYELLIRLLDKDNKIVSPFHFIDIAEKTRQIIDIGRYVLEKGMQDYCKYFEKRNVKSISINVSLVQLTYDKTFIDFAVELKKKYKIKDHCIEIEITESFFADNIKFMSQKLRSLKDAGFDIALDDFGTGYSSLSFIQELPIDTLKMDIAFVKKLPSDEKIALTIIALAKNFDLNIVAEGVENQEQSDWLREKEVPFIQGYLYSKPLPIEEIVDIYQIEKS